MRMANSYSVTDTTTFTRAHAVHIAAKVATDLKRMQRFYGEPSDEWIREFEAEIVEILRSGYLSELTYGFQRGGRWIEPTLCYRARDLTDGADDDPGQVRPGAQVGDASFNSYLTYNSAWDKLTPKQQADFERRLPFTRTAASEPDANGYWSGDLTYSAGGRALDRSSLRSHR